MRFEEKAHDTREGVRDLEALKTKVLAPSVRAALKVKKAREAIAEEARVEEVPLKKPEEVKAQAPVDKRRDQAKGDRAGVKVS